MEPLYAYILVAGNGDGAHILPDVSYFPESGGARIIGPAALLPIQVSISAQVVSVEHLSSFTVVQIDSIIDEAVPVPGLIQAVYPVDLYKVIYLTPYIHPDSLVRASMALAVPVNSPCEFPLVGYGHGTQSGRNNSASDMAGAHLQ